MNNDEIGFLVLAACVFALMGFCQYKARQYEKKHPLWWSHDSGPDQLESEELEQVADTVVVPTRTFYNRERLTDIESAEFYQARCPDCGHRKLAEGPSGGCAINFYCMHDECGSRFNEMGPFGIERITDACPKRHVVETSQGVYR